ncbi:MAG: type II toxin-antitoxin system RelE/ParE family toxin [Nitrospinae bacterium]|nr:type II toxin-antitoxin system RelE/ParE family toxin [Nitrospinota bacterium]
MADRRYWRVRLTRPAETDFQNILHWTSERFGDAQARIYADTLNEAIEALMEGPDVAGARRRDEIAEGLMTLHVARGGRRGRHFVLYRVSGVGEPLQIDVLRLLHDAMDLPRNLERN